MTMPTRKHISPTMKSAWTPTTSNWATTAFRRKRRGWRKMWATEISRAPKKPSMPTIVDNMIWVEAPTWPTTRTKGDTYSRFSLTGWSAAVTWSMSNCCSRVAPTILAPRSRSSLWTSQAPTVSIRSTSERSTTMSSNSISLSCSESLRTRKIVRFPLNRRTQLPSSTLGVSSVTLMPVKPCFNSRRAARS